MKLLFGIGEEGWQSLWAGALGALPSALIGAVVAVLAASLVARKTNRHQSAIAAEALASQQREALAQREIMESQLQEQQLEASKARLFTAVSEAVAVLHDALASARRVKDPGQLRSDLYKSFAKIRLELPDDPIHKELEYWPEQLDRLFELSGRDVRVQHWRDEGVWVHGSVLAERYGRPVADTLLTWASGDEEVRAAERSNLAQLRELIARYEV